MLSISIHAPREGSDPDVDYHRQGVQWISIHAPREGSDMPKRSIRKSTPHFNPRSPRGERRSQIPPPGPTHQFQSTLPARGATKPPSGSRRWRAISIHAPREGSDHFSCIGIGHGTISIHAPREGSDPTNLRLSAPVIEFQSTLPARGATSPPYLWYNKGIISIHAPREGSDLPVATGCQSPDDFNPRSPRGERPPDIVTGWKLP